MSKSVVFEPAKRPHQTRIVMVERDSYYGKIRSRKQFTVSTWELEQALRSAGLYETMEVPSDAKEEAKLTHEIAAYQALSTLQAGPNTSLSDEGKKARNRLWGRISHRLDLS